MSMKVLENIVNEFVTEARSVFGSSLKAIVLFGSCARGDYDEESDIDILVLLDIPPEELRFARKKCALRQMN